MSRPSVAPRSGLADIRKVRVNKARKGPPVPSWQNSRVSTTTIQENLWPPFPFSSVFRVSDYIFLDGPLLFRSAEKCSAFEGYNKLLHCKRGPYKITSLNKSTLRTNQDGLESTVSIHQTILNPTLRRHCDGNQTAEAQDAKEQIPCSETDSDEGRSSTNNTYVVSKIVRHIGFGPRPSYVVRW